jgi:drug/metabolite transporter (DMT)-like permease
MTSATRGAFLIQSTAVFTPLLSTALGQAPSRGVLLGSALALAGAVLVTADTAGGAAAVAAGPTGLPFGERCGSPQKGRRVTGRSI